MVAAATARFVFGIFEDESGKPQPVAVGMYTDWQGAGPARPQVYRTPVGEAKFAHVAPVKDDAIVSSPGR